MNRNHYLLLSLSALMASCGTATAQTTVELMPDCATVERDTWESNPWRSDEARCAYQPFAAQTTYRIFHTLGQEPRSVDLYISFSPGGESVAPPAGDMSRILNVTETFIELRNQTNEDFFLRVVLR